MARLFVFGDSYSTPHFCVDPVDSWWGKLAFDLHDKVNETVNISWPGNNIDSIAHVIVCMQEEITANDYVVVGIPPIQRLTMFNPDSAKQYDAWIFDNKLNEIDKKTVLQHHGLAQYGVHEMDKTFVMLWNHSWIEAQVLRSIVLLDSFLSAKTPNVVFLNLSIPFQGPTEWPVLKNLQKQSQKSNMLIFNDTYYSVNLEKNIPVDFDTHGWMGHHGPAGNALWYNETVKPLLEKLGWL